MPCWAFLVERADSAAWPHRNRGTCGASRDPAKSLSPPQRYYFPKAFNGAAGYQHLERGANEMGSNICACTVFLQNKVYASPLKTPFVHDGVEKAISLETNVTFIEFIQMIRNFGIRRNVAKFWRSHPRPTRTAKSFCVSLGKELSKYFKIFIFCRIFLKKYL